ncbi:MAG: hypothetical protein RIE73_15405 [Coleofasciculus sp. C1-SOL-03]|uniref:hypothetical protein n=1 Tax=Coleofasciculus sp. C1-SOL-03 TaxID=3069522 RepID=UPI003303EEA7
MKILIISYSYKPAITPRSFRWSAIAEHWVKQGHHVDVVCAWMAGLSRNQTLNGVHVHRVGGTISELLRSQLKKSVAYPNAEKSKFPADDASTSSQKIKYGLAYLSKWIHDHTWKKVYWPDYAGLWYLPALLKARQLINGHHYDGIISVSHPFTGHLVGLSLKKSYPKIKWLVDVGDPFCFAHDAPTNNHKLYQNLNYLMEEKVFVSADAVAVTTASTLTTYTSLFPESIEKITIIPPLLSNWDAQDNESEREKLFPEDEKIRLIFLGTLYSSIRRPDFLLKLFLNIIENEPSLAAKLELHFFGKIYDCQYSFKPYNTLMGKNLFTHGIVNHAKAKQAMQEADVLVNIGNKTPYRLPSKLVEYARSGKPLLNLIEIDDDSSLMFLKKYPGKILNIINEKASVDKNKINETIKFIHNLHEPIECTDLDQWLKPFDITQISSSYQNIFNP